MQCIFEIRLRELEVGLVRGSLTEGRAHSLACGRGSADGDPASLYIRVSARLPASLTDPGWDVRAWHRRSQLCVSFRASWLNGAVHKNHLLKLPEAGPYSSGLCGQELEPRNWPWVTG